MFYQLPPAGNRVHLSGAPPAWQDLEKGFLPYLPRFYASGTAALAAALAVALRRHAVADPEVILPAYGCPDLVSAVVFAGARPVLVDLVPGRPWLDLDQLVSRIGDRTAAVVAVSLLGIPERMDAMRRIARETGVLLVEDSAQSFPVHGESVFWSGDLVVLSFGRGKPVGMLGGGAVLYRDPDVGEMLARSPDPAPRDRWFRLKAATYNLLISPRLYWLPQAMPFLGLGETRYRPLTGIGPMEAERYRRLGLNIHEYQQADSVLQSRITALVHSLVQSGRNLTDLPAACRLPASRRLLRYPLLMSAQAGRDRCLRRLRDAGLGPSPMYPAALPNIRGLEEVLGGECDFPIAEDFAGRLLTLPVHEGVRPADIEKIQQVLERCVD
jgi:dTDP-4-amino-4,6-dideoxygalactose transaminase